MLGNKFWCYNRFVHGPILRLSCEIYVSRLAHRRGIPVVYFVAPQDGATLSNPVVVRFGLRNMGVAPAGVAHPNTGHHHLLIDTELAQMNLPVPADEQHVHFGGGQTQTAITLSPGEHTLQLVLGDYLHIPHDPPVTSSRITVTVLE